MKNGLFTIIEDAQAIVRSKDGGYSQVDLYQRGGRVYVKLGSKFYYLRDQGGTSNPSLKWDELVWDHDKDVAIDGMGRMALPKLGAEIKAIAAK